MAPGNFFWHLAIALDNIEVLVMLLDCAKYQLTPEELNNKLFLAKDITEKTAWHGAAEKSQLALLYKLWDWAKEHLIPEQLNNKFS